MTPKMLLRRKNGFTLVEIVVTTSILTIVGITVVAMMIGSLRGWSDGSSEVNADSSMDIALHKLYQDIRLGSGGYVANGQLFISVPVRITDANGETYYDRGSGTTTYQYYLEDKILYRKIGSDSATIFARDINEITFESVTGNTVTIKIKAQSQVGASTSDSSVGYAKIVMRNYGN